MRQDHHNAALIRNNPSHVCGNTEIFSAIIGNIRSNYLLYFLQCLINWQIIDFRLYVQYTFSKFNVAIICNQHYNSTKLSHNFLSLHDFPAGSAWKKHCNSSWPKMLELRPKYTAVFIIGSRLARLYRTMHGSSNYRFKISCTICTTQLQHNFYSTVEPLVVPMFSAGN